MHITMVSLVYPDGSECPKCEEAKQYLSRKGLIDRIDRVIEARDDDPQSEGVKIALEHNVSRFPFFVVEEAGNATVKESVIKLTREVLAT